MKRKIFYILLFTLPFSTYIYFWPRIKTEENSERKTFSTARGKAKPGWAALPMAFVPNLGQWVGPERFRAEKGGIHAFFRKDGWALIFEKNERSLLKEFHRAKNPREFMMAKYGLPRTYKGVSLFLRFLETKGMGKLAAGDRLPGYHNYFHGNDRVRWKTNVPIFSGIRYKEIYPGIDVAVHEGLDGLEYDLDLKPGAKLGNVVVQVEGADGLKLTPTGDLVVETGLGPVLQPRPKAWETRASGGRKSIECGFRIFGKDRFGFCCHGRNPNLGMVLDPKILWSSYIGGSDYDLVFDMDVDKYGFVTLVGRTNSPDYPITKGVFQGSFKYGGLYQVETVVSRINYDGSKLVWSTFLGGTGDEFGVKIHGFQSGFFAFGGVTTSKDFPVTRNAIQKKYCGGTFYEYKKTFFRWLPFYGDGFISVLGPSGKNLIFSTYLGGSGEESLYGMDANFKGLIAVAGDTRSIDFPVTPGAFQSKLKGPLSKFGNKSDAFVTVLDPLKGKVLWSTYLGSQYGGGWDFADNVVLGKDGHVTVVGSPGGSDFPATAGAWRTRPSRYGDTFITRFDPSGKNLLWSTFLAGAPKPGEGMVYAGMWPFLDEDKSGNVFVAGSMYLDTPQFLHFPTTKYAWDRKYNFDYKGVVVKMDSQGRKIIWSTYFGSPRSEHMGMSNTLITCLRVVHEGRVLIGGGCIGFYFPVTPNSISPGPIYTGLPRAFFAMLDPRGRKVLYSSYLVAKSPWISISPWLQASAIHLSQGGVATMVGISSHSDNPVTKGVFQGTFGGGGSDGFITRFPIFTPGVKRYGESTPTEEGEPTIYPLKEAVSGRKDFGFECWKAPSNSRGFLLIGRRSIPTGLKVLGVTLYVEPLLILPITSGKWGMSIRKYTIPAGLKGARIYAQMVWIQAPNWGWNGPLCATDALQVDVF